jgi:hypothetical protein
MKILSKSLVSVIKKHELEYKFYSEVVGVCCATHVQHNCLQTSVDVLPIDTEILVMKMCVYSVEILL